MNGGGAAGEFTNMDATLYYRLIAQTDKGAHALVDPAEGSNGWLRIFTFKPVDLRDPAVFKKPIF